MMILPEDDRPSAGSFPSSHDVVLDALAAMLPLSKDLINPVRAHFGTEDWLSLRCCARAGRMLPFSAILRVSNIGEEIHFELGNFRRRIQQSNLPHNPAIEWTIIFVGLNQADLDKTLEDNPQLRTSRTLIFRECEGVSSLSQLNHPQTVVFRNTVRLSMAVLHSGHPTIEHLEIIWGDRDVMASSQDNQTPLFPKLKTFGLEGTSAERLALELFTRDIVGNTLTTFGLFETPHATQIPPSQDLIGQLNPTLFKNLQRLDVERRNSDQMAWVMSLLESSNSPLHSLAINLVPKTDGAGIPETILRRLDSLTLGVGDTAADKVWLGTTAMRRYGMQTIVGVPLLGSLLTRGDQSKPSPLKSLRIASVSYQERDEHNKLPSGLLSNLERLHVGGADLERLLKMLVSNRVLGASSNSASWR